MQPTLVLEPSCSAMFWCDHLALPRQTQRVLAILSAGQFGLDVGFGRFPEDASIEDTVIDLAHVSRACLLLAVVLAGNAVGLRSVEAKDLPDITVDASGNVSDRLLCEILAPAFVKLLDADTAAGDVRAAQLQARILFKMHLG
jgi:hypothetical protein